jgi:hypothetical protein
MPMLNVLFLSTGHACRSQAAEEQRLALGRRIRNGILALVKTLPISVEQRNQQ